MVMDAALQGRRLNMSGPQGVNQIYWNRSMTWLDYERGPSTGELPP